MKQQIKELTIRKKEILHKCKINAKKIIAMKNFSKDMQNNYNILKPLKLKTSVFIGINNNNDIETENKEDMKEIEEIDEVESDDEKYDDIINEEINYTQRDIKEKIRKKLSGRNVKRNIINDYGKSILDKTFKNVKKEEKKRIKVKRAKSK